MRGMMAGLVALIVVACTPGAVPDAPVAVTATRDPVLAAFAPGDTLRYTLSWTAGARATGYLVTTTVTQGSGWSGMLTAAPTTGLSMAFTPVNTSAWDSVSFQACVRSVRGAKQSSPTCTSWQLVRSPGVPGTPSVDSSLVIAAVILKPDSVTLTTNATTQFCPYVRALDGKVRFLSGYETLPECQGHYDALPPADRLPGYPVALSHRPRWIEASGVRVALRTPTAELAHLLFAGPFT